MTESRYLRNYSKFNGDQFWKFLVNEKGVIFKEANLKDKMSSKKLNQLLNDEDELRKYFEIPLNTFRMLYFEFLHSQASNVDPKKVKDEIRKLTYRFIGMQLKTIASKILPDLKAKENHRFRIVVNFKYPTPFVTLIG